MPNFHDYESWGAGTVAPFPMPPAVPLKRANRWNNLSEAYSGAAVVSWYGNIERQLQNMIQTYDSGRNFNYADKLRQFLNTWRNNQITGSINRETLDPLEAASSQLAVDGWKCSNYFSNLRDQVRRLIASEEELPRVPQQPPPDAGGGGGGVPPPPSGDFGAQEEEPQPGSPDEIGNPPEEGEGGGEPTAPDASGQPPGAAPGGAPPATPVGQPTA